MKIEIKEITTINIKFRLHSNVSFANTIRRILLSEVPSLAIEIVEIRENKTVLADEMIAHRLGLIPMKYSGNLISKEDCDCDGFCQRCSITFTINKSNEDNNDQSIVSVTGQDLNTPVQGVTVQNSLIVKLAPKQKIDMTCIAVMGIGKSHAKFCPVTAVGFNYDPNNKTRTTKLWVENDIKKEWGQIDQSDEIDWNEINEVDMDVEIVEGAGTPKEIMLKALQIFRRKMIEVLDQIN